MLAPVLVITVLEVVSGVGTTGLLSVLGSEHGHLGLDHQVLQLHSLNQVGVPDLTSVSDTKVLNLSRELVELVASLLKIVLTTEHSSVLLHGLLHASADLGSRVLTVGVANLVKKGNRLLTSVL